MRRKPPSNDECHAYMQLMLDYVGIVDDTIRACRPVNGNPLVREIAAMRLPAKPTWDDILNQLAATMRVCLGHIDGKSS